MQTICPARTMKLLPILKYAYSLSFTFEPDYEYINFMLASALIDHMGLGPDKVFDWTEDELVSQL